MKNKYISTCCKADVEMSDPAPDFFGDDPKTMEMGTVSFLCSKCGKACNVLEVDFSDVKKVIERMGKERWKEMKKKEKKKTENRIILRNTKITINWFHTGNQTYLHLNFGRILKDPKERKKEIRRINTFTLYDSIAEDSNIGTEIWLDKVGKKAIGMSIMLLEKTPRAKRAEVASQAIKKPLK